jgi:hypothetical protein
MHIMIKFPPNITYRNWRWYPSSRWGSKNGWVEIRPLHRKIDKTIIQAFDQLQLNISASTGKR